MRIYVESFGCAQNQGEGRAIEQSLHNAGHTLAGSAKDSDAAVLVTCAVIGSTEARMVRRWRELARETPKVVVTGCLVPLRESLLSGPERQRTVLVPIRQQHSIPELVGAPSTPLPDHSDEPNPPTIEIPIAQGCTSHCSYCFSRLARGPLSSVPLSAIIDRARSALSHGAVELRLSSLDTSCWGEDRHDGARLPDLLRAVGSLEGRFRVRVGMMSPQSLRTIVDPFLSALSLPSVYQFLHLPVQSGSDSVLSTMRRGYTVHEFETIVRQARAQIPGVTISTDLIVGFPGETPEDFEASIELIERIRPPILNVTRFSPRPMTEAARRPQITSAEVKRRSRRLAALRLRISREVLEEFVGTTQNAWPAERGSSETTVARLPNYLPLVLDGRVPLGEEVQVRITGARSTYLLGRPLLSASQHLGLGQ